MLTENGTEFDHEALRQVLEQADVLTIGFSTFPQRLLVDTRTREGEGPLATIVEPVTSVQERYLWLGKHRGSFGAPEGFSFFIWPRSVRALVEGDALAPLRNRLAHSSEALTALDAALATAGELEAQALRNLVAGGEGWHTVWPVGGQ